MNPREQPEDIRRRKHEKATWVGTLSMVLQLAASGYDFSTPEGVDVLEEAKKSLEALEGALEKLEANSA